MKIKHLSHILFYFTLIILFHQAFTEQKILIGNDTGFPGMKYSMDHYPQLFTGVWNNKARLGNGSDHVLNVDSFLQWLSFDLWFLNLIYLVPIIFLFYFSIIFFKESGLREDASWISGLLTALMPAHFTFLNTGHIAKLYLIAYTFLVLTFLLRFLKSGKFWKDGLLTALFIAVSFTTGEVQVALFFAIIITIFFVYYITDSVMDFFSKTYWGKNYKLYLKFLLIPVISFLFSFHPINQNFKSAFTHETSDLPTLENTGVTETPEQKWNWATQWSIHPSETTEFFAPGIYGYSSGSGENPYWGKIGQDPNWKEHKVGFRNLHLTSLYLGIYIFFMALLGLFYVKSRMKWFYLAIAVITLLLSYGRFFPFYVLFYKLPYMDKFRNPNKFHHVFYFFFAILSAYGLNFFIKLLMEDVLALKVIIKKRLLPFIWSILGISFIIFIILAINSDNISASFNKLYGIGESNIISDNIFSYLLKFIFFFILVALPFLLLHFWTSIKDSQKTFVVIAVLLIGLLDIYVINRHYLIFQPAPDFVNHDPVTSELLKAMEQDPGRFYTQEQGMYFNYLLEYKSLVTPLEPFQMGAAARLANDYFTFFNQMGNSPKVLSIMNVKYYLSKSPINDQGMPLLKSHTFGNETVYLYKLPNIFNRVYAVHDYYTGTNLTEIFDALKSPSINLAATAVLHKDFDFLASFQRDSSLFSPVEITSYSANKIKVKANFSKDAILILANSYSPDWIATMGSKKIKSFRVNYIFNGFLIPAGENEITLEYQHSLIGLYITLSLYLLIFFILLKPFFIRPSKKK